LIVPGLFNSGPDHWQSVWERHHPEYRRVAQRDWEHPHRADWVATLDEAVGAAPTPVVLVAHSLGCVAVAHWAARQRHRVAGALLVAPPDVEAAAAPRVVRDFAPIPLAPLPFRSIVVASTDDPYAGFTRAEAWAAAWGSRFVSAGAAGHINSDAGYGPWPAGERLLAELLTEPIEAARS
jgi:hypothetical protein